MDQQKIEENVAKFLAKGFVRAGEQVSGYPLVYKKQEFKSRIICREIHIVNESTTPEATNE